MTGLELNLHSTLTTVAVLRGKGWANSLQELGFSCVGNFQVGQMQKSWLLILKASPLVAFPFFQSLPYFALLHMIGGSVRVVNSCSSRKEGNNEHKQQLYILAEERNTKENVISNLQSVKRKLYLWHWSYSRFSFPLLPCPVSLFVDCWFFLALSIFPLELIRFFCTEIQLWRRASQ